MPSFSYFGIGEAVAALAFTLAVPQFIKPIYRMRLSARRIRILYIFMLAFGGAGLALIGQLLPHLPIKRDLLLAYPVFWELSGGVMFALAYGLLAFGSVLPLKVRAGKVRGFAQAAAHFLTVAQAADHVEFAEYELANNFERLAKFANFVEWFSEPSAFFVFRHRREIEDGSYARSLLEVASDHRLCRTMVERVPWLAADLARIIDEKKIHCPAAERLVQEIALQAISSNESMLEREAGFGGFSMAPVLAQALFGSAFIARNYRPLQWLSLGFEEPISRRFVRRFNMAAELLLANSLEKGDFWQPSAHYDVSQLYSQMFKSLRWSPEATSTEVVIELTSGAKSRFRQVRAALHDMPPARRRLLYKTDEERRWGENLVEVYADMANELLEAIANDFKGLDDQFWHFAIGLWHLAFPFHQNEPAGVDPFQQRLALHLKAKVAENMEGWYPALTRLMLAVQGPYEGSERVGQRSAYVILGDVLYEQLQSGLPRLAMDRPDRLGDFIPPSVSYDAESNVLTRTYRGGNVRLTDLNDLKIGLVNLCEAAAWLEADQSQAPL